MPKIDGAHRNYLTPKIWEETHFREIFYGTLIFQQSSMICIGRNVGGHTLQWLLLSDMAAKTAFCLYLVKRLIDTLRCAVNVTTSSFQHFRWILSAKICVQIITFWTRDQLRITHFKKMMRVWKIKSLLICLRYDPLIVFRRQNHVTFIFIKTMSHDLLVQLAYLENFRLNRYHFRSDQKLNSSRISRNFPRKFPCHSPPFSEF